MKTRDLPRHIAGAIDALGRAVGKAYLPLETVYLKALTPIWHFVKDLRFLTTVYVLCVVILFVGQVGGS